MYVCILIQDQNSVGRLLREVVQRADVFTQYSFLHAFLRFVENVWKANAGIFFLSSLHA